MKNDVQRVKLDGKVKLDDESIVVLESFFNKWFNQFDRKLDVLGVSLSRLNELLVKIERNTGGGFSLVNDGLGLHENKELGKVVVDGSFTTPEDIKKFINVRVDSKGDGGKK